MPLYVCMHVCVWCEAVYCMCVCDLYMGCVCACMCVSVVYGVLCVCMVWGCVVCVCDLYMWGVYVRGVRVCVEGGSVRAHVCRCVLMCVCILMLLTGDESQKR